MIETYLLEKYGLLRSQYEIFLEEEELSWHEERNGRLVARVSPVETGYKLYGIVSEGRLWHAKVASDSIETKYRFRGMDDFEAPLARETITANLLDTIDGLDVSRLVLGRLTLIEEQPFYLLDGKFSEDDPFACIPWDGVVGILGAVDKEIDSEATEALWAVLEERVGAAQTAGIPAFVVDDPQISQVSRKKAPGAVPRAMEQLGLGGLLWTNVDFDALAAS